MKLRDICNYICIQHVSKIVQCNKSVTWMLQNYADLFVLVYFYETNPCLDLLKTALLKTAQWSNLLENDTHVGEVTTGESCVKSVRTKLYLIFLVTQLNFSSSLFCLCRFLFTLLHMLWNFILSLLSLSLFDHFLPFLSVHWWHFTLTVLCGCLLLF